MILSRFMWLELLSKSNISRPILLCDEVYNSIMRERETKTETEREREREREMYRFNFMTFYLYNHM